MYLRNVGSICHIHTRQTPNEQRTTPGRAKLYLEPLKERENLGDVSVEGKIIYQTLYECYRARECRLNVSDLG
jgi:hypothetical protein